MALKIILAVIGAAASLYAIACIIGTWIIAKAISDTFSIHDGGAA